ncbi:UNVERIFIED_CONTAM: hypothetical protein Scaly_0145300 [Sesamum calycinum]|uniref:Uncharacterized protein n=1 Tax=Sesamum calycinum TaxID=2727403 RepID=A0AAW2SWM3_9LAMI
MATPSEARAVKSLNKSSGGRRFVELNTAEDFISIYEEIFPLVQTLPQIILQKDLIVSSLLSRLKMEGRLSHEPILRLIAALSRDLLEDFIPFLRTIADSLECLLQSGADRDPEIIEQIFTSWSYIMMYLQKYLIKDVGHVLRCPVVILILKVEHTHQEALFMEHIGITKLMGEVVEEPSELRKSGVGALLSHVMRITSSKLHSRAETLIPLLVDESSSFDHQSVEDYQTMVELVGLLLTMKVVDPDSEIIDKILQLMLCIVDGLSNYKKMQALLQVSSQWVPVFDLRSQRSSNEDPSILNIFGTHILCAFNNLIEVSAERVLNLMMNFCEKLGGEIPSFLDGKSREKLSRIHIFFEETLRYWFGQINEAIEGNLSPILFQQNKLAVLWGIIRCFSHFTDAKAHSSLLMDLINTMDKLMMVESSKIFLWLFGCPVT